MEVRGGGVGDVTGDECGGAGGEALSSREGCQGGGEDQEEGQGWRRKQKGLTHDCCRQRYEPHPFRVDREYKSAAYL